MVEQYKNFVIFSLPIASNPDQLKQFALLRFEHGPASSCTVKGTTLDQSWSLSPWEQRMLDEESVYHGDDHGYGGIIAMTPRTPRWATATEVEVVTMAVTGAGAMVTTSVVDVDENVG